MSSVWCRVRSEERETYRLHGKLPVHRRRVERARRIVRDALDAVAGRWAVGVSGGKDSTVLAHLARDAGWRGPLFHFRFEETPPENTALVHVLASALDCELIDALVPGDFTTFADVGHFFIAPETDDELRAVRAGERRYKAAVEKAAVDAGLTGLFWGMRQDESVARRMTLRQRGTLYQAQTRVTWTCCPLADWSGRDVWSYTLAHDLPYLGLYDAAEDRERERSEIAWLGFEGLWRHGMAGRLRARRPDLWRRLCLRFPEISRLV